MESVLRFDDTGTVFGAEEELLQLPFVNLPAHIRKLKRKIRPSDLMRVVVWYLDGRIVFYFVRRTKEGLFLYMPHSANLTEYA